MAKSPRNQLIAFEAAADAAMDASPLAGMSARTILTFLATTFFHFLHVEGPKDSSVWKTGDTMTYRVSYLIPWLRGRSPGPLGRDAADNLGAIQDLDPTGEHCRNLLTYAHFCEVMPDVHRRRLDVELIENGFRLVHPSQEFAVNEATDIIVSELALNFIADRTLRLPDDDVVSLARTAPKLNEQLLRTVIERRRDHYRNNIREAPLVDDTAMIEMFGYKRDRFAHIQSTLFAMADVFIELGLILWIWSSHDHGGPSPEALEWVVPCWNYDGFLERVVALSGASQSEVECFVDQFALDYSLPVDQTRGGEGFTPPFFRLEGAILFPPDLILRYTHPRNALATLARTDAATFDDLLSHQLEPMLIAEIKRAFTGFDDLIVRDDITFDGGQFDLVVADATGENVMIAEVKAPLPPQGSRPTARLAGRIEEGLEQIDRARGMDAHVRAEILTRALGVDVASATIRYVIVARSCFGKIEVWDAGRPETAATLPLLRLALARLRKTRGNPARDLPDTVRAVTADVLREANFNWTHGTMPLFDKTIETPQLLYDGNVVDRWMRDALAAQDG